MGLEIYIHLILQIIIGLTWVYVTINAIYHRRKLPLHLFGFILAAAVTMLYIVTTNLTYFGTAIEIIKWTRYEWYVFDLLTALIINKAVGKCRSVDKITSWFFKKRENGK